MSRYALTRRCPPRWLARSGHRGGFIAHRGLIVVASVVPMAEAAVVAAVAPAARPLAPQVTALAPLAVFHDLRWLFAYGGSWAGFVMDLVAVVAARSVLDATLAWLAWPHGRARPRLVTLFGSGTALTLCAGLLLAPLVTLAFGVALLPFSWPFLGALPLLVLLAVVFSHGGVGTWWRTLPPVRATGWLVTEFVVLSLAAVVIGRLPGGWTVPVAGLTGAVNARAWYGVTAAVAGAAPARQPGPTGQARHVWAWRATDRLPVAPVAAVLAVGLVIGVARVGFLVASSPHGRQPAATAAPEALRAGQAADQSGPGVPQGPVVLDIQGFGSSCCSQERTLRAITGGAVARQFSYRGLDASGRPLPYGPAASDLPLPVLGDRIAAQVEALHRETGKPVDLVAESEGTLGVYAMLARHPDVPVGSLALLSPIVAPGQVSYPPGDGNGRGAVPGYALHAVVWFIGGLSPYGTAGAEKLIDSVNRTGARYAAEAARNTRRHPLRWIAVVPLADSLTLPVCVLPPNTFVVVAMHGSLLGDPGVQQMVRGFFRGAVPGISPLRSAAELMAQAAAAWRMPDTGPASASCP